MRAIVLSTALVTLVNAAAGQTPSPVSDALRGAVHTAAARLVVAAEMMPPDQYRIRPSVSEATFGEIVARAANLSILYCSRIVGRTPAPGFADESEPKDTLTAKLRSRLHECEEAFKSLSDSGLGEMIHLNGPKSRAAVISEATAFWGEVRQHMVASMRRLGVVPATPCAGPGGEVHGGGPLCSTGRNLCTAGRSVNGLSASLSGSSSIRSDTRGSYVPGERNVLSAGVGGSAALLLADLFTAPSERRAILIDLDQPAEGGTRRGIIRADNNVLVLAQQEVGTNRRLRSMSDIPVGASVPARQIAVEFPIDGAVHVLQAGPQPVGHCFSDAPAIHGRGTSVGTITRPDSTTWIIELRPGSVARLFDVRNQYPHAVDKGLYVTSIKLTLTRQP
jgi:hypothetical protein